MQFMVIPEWILVTQGIVSIAQMVAQGVQLIMMYNLMNNMVNGAWLLEQARKWGMYFDKILINYANQIYNYFIQILEGNLFTPTVIDGIMSRLYILVGIFIFFKLAALAIRYIAAPEQFLDEKAGGQQLIKRILIGSITIIMMPLIFDIAMSIQSAIISDNVIGKILLPDYIYAEIQRDKENTGKNLGMMVLGGFFGWNETIAKTQDSIAWNEYNKVITYNDISLFNESKINNKVNDQYVFSYVPIISTLAVGYYLLTLIKYAMEVALRMIKLAFLQVIAPFSIVKYMLDPADNESLKKWLNTTISTYILIFVRMFTLWFMMMMAYYLKNGMPSSDGVVSLITSSTDPVLKALIVIAMFAFLKELPKLLSDLFGYNLQENETINGVLNQATGAIKGLALGKVGMEAQKPMMYTGMAASGLGAASQGLGTAGKAFDNTGKKSQAILAGFGSGGVQLTGAYTNAMGNLVSSNMGNTAFGSFSKGANAGVQTSYAPDFRDKFESKDERERKQQEERQKQQEERQKAEAERRSQIDATVRQSSQLTTNDINNIQLTSAGDYDKLAKGLATALYQSGNYSSKDLVSDGKSKITGNDVQKIIQNSNLDPKNLSCDDISLVFEGCGALVAGRNSATTQATTVSNQLQPEIQQPDSVQSVTPLEVQSPASVQPPQDVASHRAAELTPPNVQNIERQHSDIDRGGND